MSALHLVYVPIGAEKRCIDYAHISTHSFNFLLIPEREGIVVSVGNQDGIRVRTGEKIIPPVACRVASAAVVIVPVFASHQYGYGEAESCCHPCACYRSATFFLFVEFFNPALNRQYCQTYPNGEDIERTCIGIVTFTNLEGLLVEIYYYSYSRENKKQRGYPVVARILS